MGRRQARTALSETGEGNQGKEAMRQTSTGTCSLEAPGGAKRAHWGGSDKRLLQVQINAHSFFQTERVSTTALWFMSR